MFGTVEARNGGVYVTGTQDELVDWAQRIGAAWPCATLTGYARVVAELDPRNGDLVDLNAYLPGAKYAQDTEDVDIYGAELTAWLDDCLNGTPFANLKRGA